MEAAAAAGRGGRAGTGAAAPAGGLAVLTGPGPERRGRRPRRLGAGGAGFRSLFRVVPLVAVLDGPVLSGPALLLGMADAVIMTPGSLSYLSGPAAVAEVTGFSVRPERARGRVCPRQPLGAGHARGRRRCRGARRRRPACWTSFPPTATSCRPCGDCDDPASRSTPELRDVVPASSTGSYDVRRVITAIADEGDVFELRAILGASDS